MSTKKQKNILLCSFHDLSNKQASFNTGAGFISAVLKRDLFNVRNFIWDLSENNVRNTEKLKETVSINKINVVMCGGNIYDYKPLKQLFEIAKNVSSSIVTIQGGCFVSYSPIEAMKLIPECDIGVIGEGEITICELMRAIENIEEIKNVKGIIYRNDSDELMFTEKRTEKVNLSTLPMPDYEGFFNDYLMEHGAFSVTTGRGCNFACTFCTKLSNRYRERPIEKVFEELDYYIPKYKIKMIVIQNEYFNAEENFLNIFCEKLKGYNIPVVLQTRISPLLTLDVLKKLKDAGVFLICFGLESADNTVLKSMKKGTTAELMLRVLKDTKAAQIKAIGAYIFGDPAENQETIKFTLDFIKEHRDLFFSFNLNMIALWPGSALYDNAVLDGKIEPLIHIQNGCPLVNFSQLNNDDYNFYKNIYFDYFIATELESDLNIESVKFKNIRNAEYIFTFKCISCDKLHEITINLNDLKIAIRNSRFFCDCGEKLMLDFNYHVINKDRIINIIKNYKTAFYGLENIFYKCYKKCELSELQKDDYYLIDGGGIAYEAFHLDKNLKILSLEATDELGIEKVIVTINGIFDVSSIISELKEKYPNTDFVMWYEVLND